MIYWYEEMGALLQSVRCSLCALLSVAKPTTFGHHMSIHHCSIDCHGTRRKRRQWCLDMRCLIDEQTGCREYTTHSLDSFNIVYREGTLEVIYINDRTMSIHSHLGELSADNRGDWKSWI